jgi:hypothetical protein
LAVYGGDGLDIVLLCISRPAIKPVSRYALATLGRVLGLIGHSSKLVKCLIPPARQLELTRRGYLLKAGAYATPTWSDGQRVAKILAGHYAATGRGVLAVCPGMVSITGPGFCIRDAVACRESDSRQLGGSAPDNPGARARLHLLRKGPVAWPERFLAVFGCPRDASHSTGGTRRVSNRANASRRPGYGSSASGVTRPYGFSCDTP